ncbi:MAG TPA: branched-chain amino acid ABC transporter permease [Actinomycetota bacterium]|nr:branched-chain amino acid ABC transporter permease [Actinomycetota bacterium]
MDRKSISLPRLAVKFGLIAGFAIIYCAAVGMTSRFFSRTVINEVLNLGDFLFIAFCLIAGYALGKPRALPGDAVPDRAQPTAVAYGAMAGAVAGLTAWLFLFIASNVELRSVLISVTTSLVERMSYGGSLGSALLFYVVGGAFLGALGAAPWLLEQRKRTALVVAFAMTVVISLSEPLLRPILTTVLLKVRLTTSWLYFGGGLSRVGAIIVFLASGLIYYFWKTRGEEVQSRFGDMPDQQRQIIKIGALVLLVAFLLYLPAILTSFLAEVLGTVGLYVILGLGLNIVIGYAGLLDLGYVAFLAVGSYSTALMLSTRHPWGLEWSYLLAVPITILIAIVIGIMIGAPVLRLRGDYLAIVTLGFGEIARIVVLSDWARPIFGGAQGILGIRAPELLGTTLREPEKLYYAIVICVLIVAFISVRLSKSRVGRAWNAMREDEQVAEAMGISIIGYKLLAFATGAAIGSISGIFFAIKLGSVFASSFNIIVSINVLALIILGGMGSIPGVIAGAFVLVGLPDLLREFADFRLLIYGAILVALMLFKPEGLIPSRRRKLELEAASEEEDTQYDKRAGEGGTEPVVTTT